MPAVSAVSLSRFQYYVPCSTCERGSQMGCPQINHAGNDLSNPEYYLLVSYLLSITVTMYVYDSSINDRS